MKLAYIFTSFISVCLSFESNESPTWFSLKTCNFYSCNIAKLCRKLIANDLTLTVLNFVNPFYFLFALIFLLDFDPVNSFPNIQFDILPKLMSPVDKSAVAVNQSPPYNSVPTLRYSLPSKIDVHGLSYFHSADLLQLLNCEF